MSQGPHDAIEQEPSWPARWRLQIRDFADTRFLSGVLGTLGNRALLLVVGVLSSVVITRALGAEGRGVYAVAMTIALIGVQLCDVGLHRTNTWASARDRSLVGPLLGNSLLVGLTTSSVFAVVVLALSALLPSSNPLPQALVVLTLAYVPMGVLYSLFRSLLLGLHRIRAYNLVELVLRGGALVAVSALALCGALTATTAFGSSLIILATATAVLFTILGRDADRPRSPSRQVLVELAPYGLRAYVGVLILYVVLRVDVLILHVMTTSDEVGYYSISVVLADAMYMVPAVVAGLLFARLSGIDDGLRQWRLAKTTSALIAIVMLVMGVVAVVAAEPAVHVLYGDGFQSSVPAFQLLVPGVVFLGVNSVLINYFGAIGMPIVSLVGPALGLLLNVVLNVILNS